MIRHASIRSLRPSFLLPLFLLTLAIGVVLPAPALADPAPSSDLLLPFFEVDLGAPDGRTTLFAVGNSAQGPIDVRVTVTSNWGIPMIQTTLALQSGEVRTVNLRDWLGTGDVPGAKMGPAQREHVVTALQGKASSRDGLYYATAIDPERPDLAIGAVTLRVVSSPREDVLWGDYFLVDPGQDFAEGDTLADIDRSAHCGDLCDAHRLRYLQGGGFDGGTKLVIWSSRRGQPSAASDLAPSARLITAAAFHRETGARFAERDLDLLPVAEITLADLDLSEPFGWLDLLSDEDVFVGVRMSADDRYGLTMKTWCMPEPKPPYDPPEPEDASIDLEKATNGADADQPGGPLVDPGSVVTWTYRVTNTGDVTLSAVEVVDDQEGPIACPKDVLAAGESMICTHQGTAIASGIYSNLGQVAGISPEGTTVTDEDPSHYQVLPVGPEPAIAIEKATNGHDADTLATAPTVAPGSVVTWTYVISNVGGIGLSNVQLIDDREGAIDCPATRLAIGADMTCTRTGTAQGSGSYANLGTVTAQGGGQTVMDSDPSHYKVRAPNAPSIEIEKATNGHDADTLALAPMVDAGSTVTWTYDVTNTGNVTLTNVRVTDDIEGDISCPKSTLAAGESMACVHTGMAIASGSYANVGTVTGGHSDVVLVDSDPSHYVVEDVSEPCGDCAGKVTRLTLRYLGSTSATVRVSMKRGPSTDGVFEQTVHPGGTFELVGPASGNGGFAGTLGTEIQFFVNGSFDAQMHTSCSTPIGPGHVAGRFEVLAGVSREGGNLCPVG